MKKLFILLFVLSILVISSSAQSAFKNAVLKANEGNRIFMNIESIELLNTIDSVVVNKQIRRMTSYIASFNANIVTYKNIIEKLEKGSHTSDGDQLKQDCEKKIADNQKLITERNETIILLNKLALKYGGYAITVTRTDNVTPDGNHIPERYIIDNDYKYVSSTKALPFFSH